VRKPVHKHAAYAAQRAREQEVEELRRRPGVEGERNRMVFGKHDAEFGMIVEAEHAAERRDTPWAFVDKFAGRGRKKGGA
jgi:hypothetical protein